ncbi:hypothetical protein LSPH24S_02720 [Lysinibacillus sphaericus]
MATVYLGMIEDVAVVPYLEKALRDKSAAVRRTAGDCMSDLGFVDLAKMVPCRIASNCPHGGIERTTKK